MKMKKEHYNRLNDMIKTYAWPHRIEILKTIANDNRVKDSARRFRWDCYWIASRAYHAETSMWLVFIDELYAYLNDTHIDTALKKIIENLEINRLFKGE